MKLKACVICLGLCVFAGFARFYDLAFLSEADTYFVMYASVWLRYALIAALILIFYVIFKMAKTAQGVIQLKPCKAILFCISTCAFTSAILGFFYAISEFVAPSTNFGHYQSGIFMLFFAFCVRIIFAICLILLSGFCLTIALKNVTLTHEKTRLRTIGLISAISLCLLCTLRYAEYPASVHRITYILNVCSSIASLVFFTKFLGIMYKAPTANHKTQLIVSGLSAFLFCTCIELPQTLFIISANVDVFTISVAFMQGFLGLLGAHTALKACK